MDEAKALKMYRGPFAELSPPEQFLRVMADVPRLVNKVSNRVRGGAHMFVRPPHPTPATTPAQASPAQPKPVSRPALTPPSQPYPPRA